MVPNLIAQVRPDTRGTEGLLSFMTPFAVLGASAKLLFLEVNMIQDFALFILKVPFLDVDEFDGTIRWRIAHYNNEGERYPILRLLYLLKCMSQPNLHGLKTLPVFGFNGF